MTKEDIIRMAREAGLDPDLWNYTDAFERFAALVAAAEREACAKECYDVELRFTQLCNKYFYEFDAGGADAAKQCAAAIRARGQA
jgi:hypothetical protein